jgi:hypothetical protein
MKEMPSAGNDLVAVFSAKVLSLSRHQLGAKVVATAERERRNRNWPVYSHPYPFEA